MTCLSRRPVLSSSFWWGISLRMSPFPRHCSAGPGSTGITASQLHRVSCLSSICPQVLPAPLFQAPLLATPSSCLPAGLWYVCPSLPSAQTIHSCPGYFSLSAVSLTPSPACSWFSYVKLKYSIWIPTPPTSGPALGGGGSLCSVSEQRPRTVVLPAGEGLLLFL